MRHARRRFELIVQLYYGGSKNYAALHTYGYNENQYYALNIVIIITITNNKSIQMHSVTGGDIVIGIFAADDRQRVFEMLLFVLEKHLSTPNGLTINSTNVNAPTKGNPLRVI